MKRERDNNNNNNNNDNVVEDLERPPNGPNKAFRISPETTCSSTADDSNSKNGVQNVNIVAPGKAIDNLVNNKEQDRFLPIANVGRIMKKVIPGNGKISKDAKESVQECVSEFISFVTGEASDKCQREKRKTINGDDILWAIMTLGFEDYVNPLKLYLTKYREIEGEKLNVPKHQRMEQRMQHEPSSSMPYNSVYSTTNMMAQPSFVPSDPSFPLSFSQNSVQTATLPQQDHVNEHW